MYATLSSANDEVTGLGAEISVNKLNVWLREREEPES